MPRLCAVAPSPNVRSNAATRMRGSRHAAEAVTYSAAIESAAVADANPARSAFAGLGRARCVLLRQRLRRTSPAKTDSTAYRAARRSQKSSQRRGLVRSPHRQRAAVVQRSYVLVRSDGLVQVEPF